MKKIFVIPNPKKDEGLTVTAELVSHLIERGMSAILPKEFAEIISDCGFADKPGADIDLIIVVGGDGSFIDASHYALALDIPILGINLGKRGYLSEIEPSNAESVATLLDGEYRIVEKMLLECTVFHGGTEMHSERMAVNDVVVSHSSYLGIADLTVRTADGGVAYRADGVVIATPAGSTAYSLSVGGPIVSHSSDSIIVTPIAPHSFFNRSLIFSAKDTVSVENTGEPDLNVSLDGRCFASLEKGDACVIKASSRRLKVLTFRNNNMLSVLFNKMRLMEDII